MATAQVVTLTEDAVRYPIQKITWDWLCTDLGVVSSKTVNGVMGKVVKAILASDAGGTAPTNLYDVTIEDDDGADILSGEGANVTSAATVYIVDPTKVLYCRSSNLTLKIAAAGDAKGGTVILYILRAV